MINDQSMNQPPFSWGLLLCMGSLLTPVSQVRTAGSTCDFKQVLMRLNINRTDPEVLDRGVTVANPQSALKSGQVPLLTLYLDLDPTVVQVADESGQTEPLRVLIDKITESDTLDRTLALDPVTVHAPSRPFSGVSVLLISCYRHLSQIAIGSCSAAID